MKTADPSHDAFEAQSKARMRYGTIPSKVEVPVEGRLGQTVVGYLFAKKLKVGRPNLVGSRSLLAFLGFPLGLATSIYGSKLADQADQYLYPYVLLLLGLTTVFVFLAAI